MPAASACSSKMRRLRILWEPPPRAAAAASVWFTACSPQVASRCRRDASIASLPEWLYHAGATFTWAPKKGSSGASVCCGASHAAPGAAASSCATDGASAAREVGVVFFRRRLAGRGAVSAALELALGFTGAGGTCGTSGSGGGGVGAKNLRK